MSIYTKAHIAYIISLNNSVGTPYIRSLPYNTRRKFTTDNTERIKIIKEQSTAKVNLEYISKSNIKKLYPKAIATRITSELKELEFVETAPNIKLDMFSLAIFKSYLENLDKKLSCKDAERYITLLYKLPNKASDNVIKAAYINVIWDNTVSTKTRSLCQLIMSHNWPMEHYVPVRSVSSLNQLAPIDNKYAEAVIFTNSFYVEFARYIGRAALGTIPGTNDNILYDYITGTKRMKEMTYPDIIAVVAKLPLLHKAKEIDTTNCPYYDMVIDQFKEELRKEKNKEMLAKYTANQQPITQSFVDTDKLLSSILND